MARATARRGTGRQRVLDAALSLFAERGVGGTSLQDIADVLGVTKAAVYFQFHTKREIVMAVLEPLLEQLDEVPARARTLSDPAEQQDQVLRDLVEILVTHGEVAAVLQHDRSVAEMIAGEPRIFEMVADIVTLMTGPAPSLRKRVAASLVGQGLVTARNDPALADLDNSALGRELLSCARTLLAA